MSDYIDREKLINDGISKGFCDWYDEIKYAQKVKAIQLDKVKKVRDEIQKLVDMCGDDSLADLNTKSGLGLALEKIDKLIAESEE